MYQYKAQVIRVVDGDTFEALVDLGFNVRARIMFRVNDLDTPEIYRPKSAGELEHARRASAFAKSVLSEGSWVIVDSTKSEIYSRWAANVTLPDGRDFATVMKENGYEKLKSYDA